MAGERMDGTTERRADQPISDKIISRLIHWALKSAQQSPEGLNSKTYSANVWSWMATSAINLQREVAQ